jgi:hypothetical protein
VDVCPNDLLILTLIYLIFFDALLVSIPILHLEYYPGSSRGYAFHLFSIPYMVLKSYFVNSVTGALTPGTQTMRLGAPGTTILKSAPGSLPGQQKQIITVHKTGVVTSQPQIVTLVKTTQGMTVATVSFTMKMFHGFG